MPKKAISKRPSLKPGAHISRRDPGQSIIRQSGECSSPPATVIGNSIFALTLQPKPGPLIFFARRGDDIELDEGERIFEDLWPAYMNFHYLVTGERTNMNPRKSGIDLPSCLHMALSGFKKLVPKGFEFNIDREHVGGNYYFTLYRDCEGWGDFWKQMEVGHALLVLAVKNKPLHDLFLSFLRLFSQSVGIDLWNEGSMGNSLEGLDERILNMDDTPVDIPTIQEDIDLYRQGLPSVYARKIKSAERMSALEIKRRAQRFKSPIANLIFQGCELLLSPNRLGNFSYYDIEVEDAYFLELDCQANIIWQDHDSLWYEHSLELECFANEGIQWPVFNVRIDKKLKKFDPDEMKRKASWPGELAGYMSRAFEITTKFKKNERINGKSSKKSSRPATYSRVRC